MQPVDYKENRYMNITVSSVLTTPIKPEKCCILYASYIQYIFC